jgi:hypothetical protein
MPRMNQVRCRNSKRLANVSSILLSCSANTGLYDRPRHHQLLFLRMSQQTPIGPIHRTQRQLVRENHEGSAVAADRRLAGFRLRRSVHRPAHRMMALGTTPHRCVFERHCADCVAQKECQVNLGKLVEQEHRDVSVRAIRKELPRFSRFVRSRLTSEFLFRPAVL